MRLEYIKSFISVVNYRSFSLAAQNMFLSQPTISTHIKQLENELGVQLLVRSTKDVILSEAGLTFYPYAVRLLETENEAIVSLEAKESQISGTVSIASSSVPGNYVLPYFFAEVRGLFPDISFKVSEGDSVKVIQEVRHFDAEIGVGSIRSTNDKCNCEPLFQDEIVLITPNTEKYRAMNGKFPNEQFKNERFVLRESGSGTKMASENMERSLKLDLNNVKVAAQFESSEMVRRAVEAGVGIAFISRLAVRNIKVENKLLEFRFENVNSRRQLYVLCHKDRVLSIAARTTMKALRKFCQNFEE